ncbi:MAG: hypothetical protein Q9219_003575, partial [cf. Caloplaca sp. 3 TL-2023]
IPPGPVQENPPSVADPDEGYISNSQYPSRASGRDENPTETDVRQLLRSPPPPGDAQYGSGQQQADVQSDPMVQMLQQIVGGMSGVQESEQGGLPSGLGSLLLGGGPTPPGTLGHNEQGDTYGSLWRILHAVLALLLAIGITAMTTFNGAHFAKAGSSLSEMEDGVVDTF